jgi:hypothetical protein
VANLDLTWAVRGVDSLLRSRQGIEEFTDDRECLLRISLARADRAIVLSDGIGIRAGESILRLHLWNEHLPVMPDEGPSAAWANLIKRRMRYSLAIIAGRLDRDARLAEIHAMQGAPTFPRRLGPLQLARIAGHFGFDVIEPEKHAGTAGQLHALFDSVLLCALIWAFNPAGLRGKGLLYRRCEIWMSRRKLIDCYLGRPSGDLCASRSAPPSQE